MIFRDRQDAGRQLAERLQHLREEQPIVLGLPRGGVVVAAEIARALHAPLDVLVVRKIGAPHQPELALGAVTDGRSPMLVLNEQLVGMLGLDRRFLQDDIDRELAEVRRRQQAYRRGRAGLPIEGHAAIVVDDGIATGATVRAALRALRQANPRRLILVVPVAPRETIDTMLAEGEADEIICLETPPDFRAVGLYYENFEQTTDEEVIELLGAHAAPRQ